MGLTKRMMEEYENRGYGGSSKCVCADCIGNKHLKKFVLDNGTDYNTCDFCGNEGVCVGVEELCGQIMTAVCSEYEKAIESMGWNGKEGGYIGATTWDSYELLAELNEDMLLEPGVLDEICGMIDHDTWCKLNPYSLRASEEHKYMWQRFSRMVKNKTRYVFFRMPERDKYDEESDFLVLDHIGNAVYELGLVKKLPKQTIFFRGRTHDNGMGLAEMKDLCSPPSNVAPNNRMSSIGISMFYAADNKATTIAEINDGKPYATIAEFVNFNELHVLDLADTSRYAIPCLFYAELRHLREPAKFLYEFHRDLTRNFDEMEDIEYIPSQIVTEYLRFLYEHDSERIDGIAYGSSKNPGNTCYVLFFDYEQCLSDERPVLRMINTEQYIRSYVAAGGLVAR